MNKIVGINADQIRVKSGMMDFGQRQSICHYGLPKILIFVLNDVSGIKKPLFR
jgi:hypothetical protein